MTIELRIPSAGESISEVTIVEWLKEEGASARPDEIVAVIETDKANVEVLAPVAGRITRILKPAGQVASVGEVIGYMEAGDGAPLPTASTADVKPPPAEPAKRPLESQRIAASPSVRRALREADVSPSEVKGSGPGGRIERSDLSARNSSGPGPAKPVHPTSLAFGSLRAPLANFAPAPAKAPIPGDRRTEVVPMSGIRKRIAQRLVEAQSTAALLTTFNEIDMTEVLALRARYQEEFTKKNGVKLGLMSFFVKAAVEALEELPALNAEIRGEDIVYHRDYDIGVAVGGGRGLVVPVIRNAERLSFAEIEKTIADFGARAKANALTVAELSGGTFTISNGGVYGSLMSTPIVNPPQSGILGMHAIQERPIVKNGQIVVAKMMYVALTYDHRIVDGREAVTFLVRIKENVEHPARMLLEV
jgi:2-oxoglutarate dehydrogenase E2 component (dihydrolipoamide succinyltransferase)